MGNLYSFNSEKRDQRRVVNVREIICRSGFRMLGVFIFSVQLWGCSEEKARSVLPVGQTIPTMVLGDMQGASIDLERYRGKTLILNVWATWCPPCRAEMPALDQLSKRLPAKDYKVLALSIDEDMNLVREFLIKYKIDLDVVVDRGGQLTTRLLGVESYPETLIISKEGVVLARISGEKDWAAPHMVNRIVQLSGS